MCSNYFQIAEFTETTLLIIGHGAAVTNAMFLPDNAAVIEIFPWKAYSRFYRRMLGLSGFSYFPLNSLNRGNYLSYSYLNGGGQSIQTLV